MLLRLLIRLVLNWTVGDPDAIQQDERPWPTWVVVTLMLLIIGALVGGYFWLAASKGQ